MLPHPSPALRHPVSAVQTGVQAFRCVRDGAGGGGRELQWGKEEEQRALGYGKCRSLFYRQVFKTSSISGLRVPKGGFQNSCYG